MARAIANHGQAHTRLREERAAQGLQPLLGRVTSHVEHEKGIRMAARELVSHRRISWSRTEALRVDPALPQSYALECVGAEDLERRRRGTEVHLRLMVQHAEVGPQPWLEEAVPVVMHIARKIGMERRNDRHVEPAGDGEAKGPKEERTDDVDEV